MSGFSATDAALEGFRITRERPRALLAWTGFSFAVSVLSIVISLNLPAEMNTAMQDLESKRAVDVTTLMTMLATVSPLIAFGLIVQCVMAAAVYRIILKPEDTRYSYLRLGKVELELALLTIVYVFMATFFVAGLQLAVLLVSAVASAFGSTALDFVWKVGEVFSAGVVLYVAVRLSLAPIITFDTRKISIFESWELTRGQFWRLFGAYALAICCLIVFTVLLLVVFLLIAMIFMIASGGSAADLVQILKPDEVSLKSYLNPFMVAYLVVASVFTAIYYAVIAAPGAWAYRALKGGPQAA